MKILLLTYRGNPFCGGQGVYVSHLGRELVRLGHEVHCLHGPPYAPENGSSKNGDSNDSSDSNNGDSKDRGIIWHRVEGLNPMDADGRLYPPGRPWAALSPINFFERAAALAGQFPEMTAFSWRAFNALRDLLRHHRFDVVHDNQSLGWGLLAIRALGIPTLATIHHPLTIDRARGFDPPTSFRDQLGKVRFYPLLMQGIVARCMRHVVTVSHAAGEDIVRDFRVPSERIRVIHNGLDTEHFRPLPDIPRVPGRVVFVGNLEDPNKGGIYLLRALASLPPPAHLVVATGGISRQAWLDDQLESLGIAGRVHIRRQVPHDELVRLYASAQVAVSPSLYEGFGFPAGEAMACGLPLVAADGGALPEVVGDAGVIVPKADAKALAAGLAGLLGDPTRPDTLDAAARRRETLGAAARQRAVAHFRWDTAARALVDVYRETIDAHR